MNYLWQKIYRKFFWQATHQHYKGGLYRVITEKALMEKDLSPVVVYEDETGKTWVRSVHNFYENAYDPLQSKSVPRFKEIK